MKSNLRLKASGLVKLIAVAALVSGAAFIPACKKKNATSSNPETPAGGKATVTGIVVNENGSPLSGATVKNGEVSATCDASGGFTLNNIPEGDRVVLTVSVPGYFDAFRAVATTTSQTGFINVTMVSKGQAKTFSGLSSGYLTDNGGNVSIGPNTLVDASGNTYTGTVSAYLRFMSPAQDNFGAVMQGGDFMGQNATDQEGVLTSYGYFSLELEDATGGKLNLKSGSAASFAMQIDPQQSASAPSTVKLWSFDRENGIWKEEGTATKAGDKYIAQVGHFSEWNCDDWSMLSTLKGKITCDGEPAAKLEVTIKNGRNTIYAYTGSSGEFTVNVPSGFTVSVKAPGMAEITAGPLSQGQLFDMGTKERCSSGFDRGTFKIGNSTYTATFHGQFPIDSVWYQVNFGCPGPANILISTSGAALPNETRNYTVAYNSTVTGHAHIYAEHPGFYGSAIDGGVLSVTVMDESIRYQFQNIKVTGTDTFMLVSGTLNLPR